MEVTATMMEVIGILIILLWTMQSMAAIVVKLVNASLPMVMVLILYTKNHQQTILLILVKPG